jgi:ankyrin repeat protein
MTALHFAALNGDWAIAEELLSRKPFDWSKARGWTPLHYAAWQGHVEFVQKLCARVPALLKMPLKTAMMGERGPFTPLELADYGCALSQAEWLEVKLVLEPKCLSDRVRMAKCAQDESKLINELQGEVAEQLGISDALKSKKCNDADKKRLKDGVNERLKQVWMPRRQAMHKALCELGFK